MQIVIFTFDLKIQYFHYKNKHFNIPYRIILLKFKYLHFPKYINEKKNKHFFKHTVYRNHSWLIQLHLYSFYTIYILHMFTTLQFSYLSAIFIFRVFVNRSLHLEKIKFFGFDMDYTLAGNVVLLYLLLFAFILKNNTWTAFLATFLN